jgi:hypothetical protein
MNIKSTLILWLLLVFPANKGFSQDSTKFFVGYDLFKGIINEHSVTLGYKLGRRHLIMLSPGYTYHNKSLTQGHGCSYSPSQDNYPFFVYKGPTIRTAYEFRFYPFFYAGVDFYYKYLHYPNFTFIDSEGDPGDVTFIRNEKSDVYGFHINSGFIISIPRAHLIINPSFGIGESFKSRNYNTISVKYRGDYSKIVPTGTFTENQQYLSIMSGINIAIAF